MKRQAFLALALVALTSCDGGGEQQTAPLTVDMTEAQRFEPDSLTVEQGATVTFVNDSSQAHTATAYDDAVPESAAYFSSGDFESEEDARANLADALIGQEGSYEVTFETPGTYEYFCIPHEDQGMKGTIVVEGG